MRRSLPFLCVLFLLSVPSLAAFAGDEEPGPGQAPSIDQAERIAQRFLRMTMGGNHAGGIGMRVGTLPDGGTIFTMRMLMQMTRGTIDQADSFRVEQTGTEVYDAAGRAVSSEEVMTEAGVATRIRATFSEKHVDLLTEGPGGTYRKQLVLPDDYGTDYLVFQELRREYESAGKDETVHRAYSSLDAPGQDFKPSEMWVLGRTTYEHGGRAHAGWKVKQRTEDLVAEGVVGDDYLPYEMSLMNGFMKATWVDEPPFEVEGGGWSFSAMVEVDRGVERAYDLEELEVRFVLDPPPPAESEPLFEDSPNQTVKREADGYRMVLHGRRPPIDFVPPLLPMTVEDTDAAAYLEATPNAQSDNPKVAAAAARIVAGAPNALVATQRVVHWVWANVAKRSGARGGATAVEVLDSMEGDCTEHAVLVVALSRAAGIPARAVGGLVYVVTGEGKPFAGYHAWAEVWLGRWVPVDATIPEVGTSARYARVSIDEPGHPDRGGRMLTALASKTRLEILAWKHYGGKRVEATAKAE